MVFEILTLNIDTTEAGCSIQLFPTIYQALITLVIAIIAGLIINRLVLHFKNKNRLKYVNELINSNSFKDAISNCNSLIQDIKLKSSFRYLIFERLAYCYSKIADDDEISINKIIENCEKVLKLRRDEGLLHKESYAATLMTIGLAHSRLSLIREKEKNIIKALDYYLESSKYVKNENTNLYSILCKVTGDAYCQYSLVKDQAENLLKATRYYSESAKYYDNKNYSLHLSVGNAWRMLAVIQDKAEEKDNYISLSIKAYTKALSLTSLEQNPLDYAIVSMNLGIGFHTLSEVRDREENLTNSINAYREALKVCTIEKHPFYNANINMNLAISFNTLAEVDESEKNSNLAIDLLNMALNVFLIGKYPINYAIAKMNLGNAFILKARKVEPELNLKLGLDAYNDALGIFTQLKYPEYYNTVQLCISNAVKENSKNG